MQYGPTDSPVEADVRFQGYRLEVIGQWATSPRKVAVAEAISQRLTAIGRSALARPDIVDLLHLSCQLLDDFFAAGGTGEPGLAVGDWPDRHAADVSRSIIS
jgi:hypothetical protein